MESLLLKAGKNRLEVIPDLGGTIRQLFLTPIAPSFLDYPQPVTEALEGHPLLLADNDEELAENPWFRGRFMFPFCDRIPGGKYSFDGKRYQLPLNQEDGSAIHGLIHNRPGSGLCRITTSEEDQLHLSWRLGEDPGYPFPVEFSLLYHLDPRGLTLRFLALNRGSTPAPVGFGWHPYFSLPGGEPDAYTLTIPADAYTEVEENLMPTGRFPRFSNPEDQADKRYDFRSGRKIGKNGYDIAYPVKLPVRGVVESSSHRLILETDGAFSFLQLFTPPDRKGIALEPVSNITDAFNRDDMGMRVLQPGKRLAGLVRIELEVRELD